MIKAPKTYAVAVGEIVTTVSIRRLPMRPGDNDTRYRVRLVRTTLGGKVISNGHRDMPMDKAYRVYEQNVNRLADLVG